MSPFLAEISSGGLLEKLRDFQLPSQAEYIDQLASAPHDFPTTLTFILLFGCGLVYLLQGWKIFKILVVVNAAILGSLIGWQLGAMLKGANAPLFCSAAGGLLLAVLSLPAMKYAISIMGALAGSFLGYALWNYAVKAIGKANLAEYAWTGALVGLITLGLLAFVVFRLVVMIFTSVQGAVMTVTGALGLLMMSESLGPNIQSALKEKIHLLPLLLTVPTVIGFALQISGTVQKVKKKKKAAAGGD